MRGRQAWLAAVLALAPLLAASHARAYCRSSTCKDCPRDEEGCTIGGTELAWAGRCVGLGLHADASEQVDLATVERLAEEAFASWNAVRCEPSGLPPSIELFGTDGPIACGRSEFVGDSANVNVLVFRDHSWPYGGSGHELATTTVRSRADGEIVDADIEVNATRPLLIGGGQDQGTIVGAHDLPSILVHEMGHLLGLDHSTDPESIMQIELPPRAVRTTLGADDVAALCAAYPPERAAACDPTPRGDFSPQCALDPSTGGACRAAHVGASSPDRAVGGSTGSLALLLTVAMRLRARAAPGGRRHSRSLPRMPCFQSSR
jgi:hypothetical protein